MSKCPDAQLLDGAGVAVLRAACAGLSLASDVDRLIRLLGKRPYKKLSCASSVDNSVVHAVLYHALHHDHPGVVTRLRTTCAAAKLTHEIYGIDHRKRISDRCMVALLAGIDREPLAIRVSAMGFVCQDSRRVAPIVDIVVGELFAGEEGRGRYGLKSPGHGALAALLDWAATARSIAAVVATLEARASAAKTSTAARGALGALLVIHARFADLELLATTPAARTAVLEGAYVAVRAHRARVRAPAPVPAHPAFQPAAIAAMTALAKTKLHREIVAAAEGNVSRKTFSMFSSR
ncbi:MAG: hypothetical protein WKG01_00190 [Kofleriaceae bacterium]